MRCPPRPIRKSIAAITANAASVPWARAAGTGATGGRAVEERHAAVIVGGGNRRRHRHVEAETRLAEHGHGSVAKEGGSSAAGGGEIEDPQHLFGEALAEMPRMQPQQPRVTPAKHHALPGAALPSQSRASRMTVSRRAISAASSLRPAGLRR